MIVPFESSRKRSCSTCPPERSSSGRMGTPCWHTCIYGDCYWCLCFNVSNIAITSDEDQPIDDDGDEHDDDTTCDEAESDLEPIGDEMSSLSTLSSSACAVTPDAGLQCPFEQSLGATSHTYQRLTTMAFEVRKTISKNDADMTPPKEVDYKRLQTLP